MITLIDGERTGSISVADGAVLRGDGCFEAIQVYGTVPFALDDHLDRLARRAALLELDLPPRALLGDWCRLLAAEGGDGVIRIILTRGSVIPDSDVPSRCIVLHHASEPVPAPLRVLPVPAPWHSAGRDWELAGAKTISYAPNQAATRRARRAGFHEALLHADDGTILEGPTFAIAWVVDETVETPTLDLKILDSITRRFALEDAARLGIAVREGRFPLSRLAAASEVMAWSTTKEVAAVGAVGDLVFEPGPVTAALADAYRERITAEVRAGGGSGA